MKKKAFSFPLLFILLFTITGFKPVDGFKLKVKIYNLHSSQGQVIVMLYNKEGTIPDKNFSKFYKRKITTISDQTAYVEFENLPPGRYAVNFFHDENANGKLDKRFIKPKEGFGLTRFQSVNFFNKPNFKKAAFNLKHDTLVQIKTIYL